MFCFGPTGPQLVFPSLLCPLLYPFGFALALHLPPPGVRHSSSSLRGNVKLCPLSSPEGNNNEIVVAIAPRRGQRTTPKGVFVRSLTTLSLPFVAPDFTPSGGTAKQQLVFPPVRFFAPLGQQTSYYTLPLWGKTKGGKAVCAPKGTTTSLLFPSGDERRAKRRLYVAPKGRRAVAYPRRG